MIFDDPSSNPDNYKVVTLQFQGRFALFTSKYNRWIYVEKYFDGDWSYSLMEKYDIIYFKQNFHTLICGYFGSIKVYIDEDTTHKTYIKLELVKGVEKITNVMGWDQSYLAESINGTLLYVERFTVALHSLDFIRNEEDDNEEKEEPFHVQGIFKQIGNNHGSILQDHHIMWSLG